MPALLFVPAAREGEMRKPSPETQLRRLRASFEIVRAERDSAERKLAACLDRAIKAEKSEAEWKLRFDALLKIFPEAKP